MKKLLKILQILVYYDLPEIFLAKDTVGTNYLCLLVDSENQETVYISTAISQSRLISFINGVTDLRDIFVNPEINEWFYFKQIGEIIEALKWQEETLPEAYLPLQGFIFQKQLQSDELILNEVIEKNNAVIHLAVSDSNDNYSIDADNLGDIVKLYQVIIENSFKKALIQHKIKDKISVFIPPNYKLRAFASSYSSFNLHFFSTAQIDLFGNSIIEFGLSKFDEITRDFTDEDEFIGSLRTVKGHTIGSLKKLVKKLLDSDIKIKHKWFAPNQEKVHLTVIDKIKAEKIYEILNLKEELAEEIRTFIGFFVQVDVEKGTWRILNLDDEKEYSGEAQGEILQGVTVKTVNYRIVCQEIIEELKVSEKEKVNYILRTIDINE